MDDGWDDEEEGWDFDDDPQEEKLNEGSEQKEEVSDFGEEDGWGDDDDLGLDEEDIPDANPLPPPQQPPRGPSPKEGMIYDSLVKYYQSFSFMQSSLEAVLNQSADNVHDLCEYYASRPHLREYTLEKELSRMKYRMILPNQDILMEKEEIFNYLSGIPPEHDFIIRVANQSLLADAIAALSGPDLFIQPQFMASAVASDCSFLLDLRENAVEALCVLVLSIPGQDGQRLHLAEMTIQVRLEPGFPRMSYHVMGIQMKLPADSIESSLRASAAFLAEIDIPLEEQTVRQHPSDSLRDAFMVKLSNTQRFVEASNEGLKGAWKQIDAVANVSSKIGFVRNAMPSLPSEIEDLHSPVREEARPKSILGGFLSSGFSRLAQTVTEAPTQQEPIQLYQRQPPPPPPMKSSAPPIQSPPKRKPPPPPAPPQSLKVMPPTPPKAQPQPPKPVPVPENEEDDELVEDEGWGDDDLDFDEVEESTPEPPVVETAKPPPPPPKPSMTVTTLPKAKPTPPLPKTPPKPPPRHRAKREKAQDPKPAPPLKKVDAVHLFPEEDYPPKVSPLINYNPEDDIIPTRKKWIHPRLRVGS